MGKYKVGDKIKIVGRLSLGDKKHGIKKNQIYTVNEVNYQHRGVFLDGSQGRWIMWFRQIKLVQKPGKVTKTFTRNSLRLY